MKKITLASRHHADISVNEGDLERQRLLALINNMVDGVLAVDAGLKIQQYNAAALDILDVNGAITGQPLAKYLKPIDELGEAADIRKYLRQLDRAEIRRDLKLAYSDGSSSTARLR